MNGDFEDGPGVAWGQSSTRPGAELIKPNVGHYYSWGAELGGQNNSTDGISQLVYMPSTTTFAFVSFRVKMKTWDSSTQVHDELVAVLADLGGNILAILATYDNTGYQYLWTKLYSPDLSAYRGQWLVLIVMAHCDDNWATTTFYVDDVSFLAEVP